MMSNYQVTPPQQVVSEETRPPSFCAFSRQTSPLAQSAGLNDKAVARQGKRAIAAVSERCTRPSSYRTLWHHRLLLRGLYDRSPVS